MNEEIKNIINATSMGKLEKEVVLKSLLNLHSVMPCYELEGEAEEFWQETPDLITLERNGVKIWTDNDSEYKLKEGEKYSVKIYKT